ncbi:NAD(P)/FAD-dependent oxidoreductase [Streptomyces sp. NPDC056462]|uniref:NAD(P)/FAD-dependent oxidoreductase n=1 Tax=Streptomyces sp. NPDC056462 TaxID=3345826 RepID=UPI0036903D73
MNHRLVVVGAGYAGLLAPKLLARKLRRSDVTVTLVNASDRFVERVRLHQLAAGQRLAELPLHQLLSGTPVRLVDGRVTAIDTTRRTSRPERSATTPWCTRWAAGRGSTRFPGQSSTPALSPTLNRRRAVAAPGCRDCLRRHCFGDRRRADRAETASELAESYPELRARLFTGADDVGSGLAPRARTHLRRALDWLRVSVRPQTVVAVVRKDGLDTREGMSFAADAVVWTRGFRAPELARAAGFVTDESGRMLVDASLRSVSHPDVYAVGGAAAGESVGGAPGRMSCQTALPMSRGRVGQ